MSAWRRRTHRISSGSSRPAWLRGTTCRRSSARAKVDPQAPSTTGLVAYCGGEAAGWCAVEPRTAYPRLLKMRVPWTGRDENKADDGIWAVTCFVVRKGYRRRGVASALAQAAVDFARERGARAVEGYPRVTLAGEEVGEVSLYVGSWNLFAAAGFREVSRPTPRRVVMRVDF
nr:GNAT family N-acetyltransferase [Actinopolymorpha alba]